MNIMSDLNSQVRVLATAIEAKKAEAAKAWAEFDGLRQSAKKEGVDFTANADAFDKLDAASKAYDAIRDEVASMEGKRSRLLEIVSTGAADHGKRDEHVEARTMGEAFTKSDAYRALLQSGILAKSAKFGSLPPVEVADREQTKRLISAKANLTEATSGAGGIGDFIQAQRLAGFFGMRKEGLTLLDLVTVGATDSNVVEWVYESARTEGAAFTAEAGTKQPSDFSADLGSAKVEKIAHYMKITREAMADVAGVETYINERLVDGVRRKLNTALATGNGNTPELRGLYNTNGIGSQPQGADSLIVALHKAITTVRVNYWGEPNAIGIHPLDWESIRLQRDDSGATAGTGGFLFGSPASNGDNTLWGLPVAVSTVFGQGNPMVGNFREAFLWVREGVSVTSSDSDGDNFVKNLVTVLAEMRAAFGVIYPAAFCEVTSGS